MSIPIQETAMHIALPLLQASTCTGASAISCFPSTPLSWISVAIVAVLCVVMVAAVIYMLSNIIRSERSKQWSRFQIYEAFLSLILIFAFASIAYIFFLNPQNLFGTQLNIIPCAGTSASQSGCSSTGTSTSNSLQSPNQPGCTGATQLFTLATCDLSIFNNATYTLGSDAFLASYIVDLVPGVSGKYSPISTGIGIDIGFEFPSLVPLLGSSGLIGTAFQSLLGTAVIDLLVFNQIQLIVLAGAVLFLSIFITLGLIARTLGFSRTFGGAMIAFGLGIGIIFPLLVVISYGYIDVSAGLVCVQSLSCSGSSVIQYILSLVFNPGTYQTTIWTFTAGTSGSLASLGSGIGALFLEFGYVVAGLIFIPIINIAIVDAFIIDFSTALGERISFGELFSSFI